MWSPAYLRDHLLPHGRLIGWTPDWYAGFPAFQYYMILPSLAVVLLNVGLVPWAAALTVGLDRLRDIAFERAIDGVPVPVFYKGEQCGEKRWYNDRLLMFILRHHLPAKYGALAALPPGTKHPDTVAREAEATTVAVGSPRAISRARLGPETTANRSGLRPSSAHIFCAVVRPIP